MRHIWKNLSRGLSLFGKFSLQKQRVAVTPQPQVRRRESLRRACGAPTSAGTAEPRSLSGEFNCAPSFPCFPFYLLFIWNQANKHNPTHIFCHKKTPTTQPCNFTVPLSGGARRWLRAAPCPPVPAALLPPGAGTGTRTGTETGTGTVWLRAAGDGHTVLGPGRIRLARSPARLSAVSKGAEGRGGVTGRQKALGLKLRAPEAPARFPQRCWGEREGWRLGGARRCRSPCGLEL